MITLRHFSRQDAETVRERLYPDADAGEAAGLIDEWNAGVWQGRPFGMFAVLSEGRLVGQASLLEGGERLKAQVCRAAADSLTADALHYRDDGTKLSDVELLLTEMESLLDTLDRSADPESGQLQEVKEKLERAKQSVQLYFPS